MSPKINKIKDLLEMYNDILAHSMNMAITQGFINLVVVNIDAVNFELQKLTKDKSPSRVP
tara:strand:- start:382 stop:561 length:180 start_codon:yes stop_codon:yes gene_type:complete